MTHFMYMDDCKIFTKHIKEVQIFIQTIRIYNLDIEIELGLKNARFR